MPDLLQSLSKREILLFCKLNNKQVYLIRSPQHPQSLHLINDQIYKHILQSKFSSIEYLDLNIFLLKNKKFMDLEHLNSIRAKKFSIWFVIPSKYTLPVKYDKNNLLI